VQLTVEDTGIGIPEEERYNIFSRFYRVDKARSREAGGSGLGLSIVHDAVKAHGGSIAVGQNKPRGSRFIVSFPLYSIERT
jgi:signal transduction histidine kinase